MKKKIARELFVGIILGIVVFFGVIAADFIWWAVQQSPKWIIWVVGVSYTIGFLLVSWWLIKISIKGMKIKRQI